MHKDKTVEIVLSGGLGNQLFLFAASLGICDSYDRLIIECCTGKPRLSRNLEPDLLSFTLPKNIDFKRSSDNVLSTHLHLFLLKLTSKVFKLNCINKSFVQLKNVCGRVLAQLGTPNLFLSDGVGFDPRLKQVPRKRRIIGNFHTYRYANSAKVDSVLQGLTLSVTPEWLVDLQRIASVERPIVVQIRRGDYLGIEELGILGPRFFIPLIQKMGNEFPKSEIWLFTDDYDQIWDFIPHELHSRVRLIDYDIYDSAGNLQAMREGRAFIISNSTFGWWGAYLSYAVEPVVLCPQNWLKTLPNPKDLVPLNWIKVPNR